ncbi:MAG: hypothetical protein FJY75_03305 [Candidatus Eisenbacteria bacterium]|uniref:Uncharacterized protein n=1 Tax=Eiseniibacteriota bacterium TaxID=2212470 RepID=A0A938BLB1_UNCEI|nr:hypothetical protein [Candidatus Eisenbacteria bacterium]
MPVHRETPDEPGGGDPLAEISRAVDRTLWILYAGFAFAVLVYLVLFLLMSVPGAGGPSAGGSDPEAPWPAWRYAFLAAGIASLYASFRLRPALLDPRRLARRVERSDAASLRAESAAGGPGGAPPGRWAHDRAAAAREFVSRVILGHVLLWGILEIPALLGVVDRILGGETGVFIALIAMSAIGLAAHRPDSARTAEILRARFLR